MNKKGLSALFLLVIVIVVSGGLTFTYFYIKKAPTYLLIKHGAALIFAPR